MRTISKIASLHCVYRSKMGLEKYDRYVCVTQRHLDASSAQHPLGWPLLDILIIERSFLSSS